MKLKLIIILFSFSFCVGNESILGLLKNHYADIFKVESKDVHIDILKAPRLPEENIEIFDARISSNQYHIKVGNQHAWLTLSTNGVVSHKIPLSISLTVKKDVWVSTRRIKRDEILTQNMLQLENIEIMNNYSKYHFGDLDYSGTMKISRKIETGTILTKQMFDYVPDVKRGDKVIVSLQGDTFAITLTGKARESGLIGEEIYVMLESTGKRLKGLINSQNQIIVKR